MVAYPTNAQKKQVWLDYRAGKPTRVPVVLGINPRIVLLDPRWNPKGYTFADYFRDARVLVDVHCKFLEAQLEFYNRFRDASDELPERLDFYVGVQNCYDAAYFGCPIVFRDGQVPDTTPILEGRHKSRIFDLDIDHPLENPFIRQTLDRYHAVRNLLPHISYRNLPLAVQPPLLSFDGPMTLATCLRGHEIFMDMLDDPEYFERLMTFLTHGVIKRNKALCKHFGVQPFDGPKGFIADDSIQLVSTDMYQRQVLPHHRHYLAQWSVGGPHGIHLCGDATRHFPLIQKSLNVYTFDTGFPVDFAALRKALGPQTEIQGGPEVSLLTGGTAGQVYERTRDILRSGIMEGGRFILREANNLPPGCPEANLAAMYQAALEHGTYA